MKTTEGYGYMKRNFKHNYDSEPGKKWFSPFPVIADILYMKGTLNHR